MRLKKIFSESFSTMKESKLWLVTIFLLFLYTAGAYGQAKSKTKTKSKTPAKTQTQPKTTQTQSKTTQTATSSDPNQQHQQKVKDMVAFLEFVLNTLGSNSTSSRDKDVLITESYTKIFRDAKVQVEDDLAEKRNVITNKDVQAYLKDVDFFFENVKFEFTIQDIQGKTNSNNKLFYKVSLLRNMKGTTAEGKPINNTMPRYIEVNYDPEAQDLKIVSIYTRQFNQTEALTQWWNQLSYEWQSIFERQLNIRDSVTLDAIQDITAIETLDLSHNKYIQDIEPLGQLSNLRVLNLSNTAITDLSPVRNLTELQELNLSGTKVSDISALRYSDKLVKFNINNTSVADIAVIEKMSKLEQLEVEKTAIADFTPLGNLTELQLLNVRDTKITTLTPIAQEP
jgi:Leucine-rich repeat (LRR) protein